MVVAEVMVAAAVVAAAVTSEVAAEAVVEEVERVSNVEALDIGLKTALISRYMNYTNANQRAMKRRSCFFFFLQQTDKFERYKKLQNAREN
jgi:hypothetical protein